MSADYATFVATKLTRAPATGIEPPKQLRGLFPFQRDLVRWALRRGRAAIFAGTGLGKTRMLLRWADAVRKATGRNVLVLAPLAVAPQIAAEGEAISVKVTVARDAAGVRPGINVTNYERLGKFDPALFGAVVLDESSCIKHHDTKTLKLLLEAFRATPFKLCCTATPAPNDWTELGTHAEFLGACTRQEMLSEFFVHDGGETQKWRLKGHARGAFWRWVATWGALVSHPRDLGEDFDDARYDLQPLVLHEHIVRAGQPPDGYLFVQEADTLMERRRARSASLDERVQACVDLIRRDLEWTDANTSGSGTNATASTLPPTDELTPTSETPSDANATLPTRKSAKRRAPRSATIGEGTPAESERRHCERPSESESQTTNACSPSRVAAAPSADASGTSTPTGACTSTTATAQDASADFCAPRATSDSESSATTLGDSSRPRPTFVARPEQWVVWCDLNAESEQLAKLIPGAVEIRGSMTVEEKERRLEDFAAGKIRVLVTKASMTGWGLNWQFCNRMAFVGVTDSWEAYYQAVRRCWRFGQPRAVEVHIFASQAEGSVVANLKRKEQDAAAMGAALAQETAAAVRDEVRGAERRSNDYRPDVAMEVPSWVTTDSPSQAA